MADVGRPGRLYGRLCARHVILVLAVTPFEWSLLATDASQVLFSFPNVLFTTSPSLFHLLVLQTMSSLARIGSRISRTRIVGSLPTLDANVNVDETPPH